MTVKVSGNDSRNTYTLTEKTHPANAGPALHIRRHALEAYYVLEGEYSIRYGEMTFLARQGDFIFIPKGVPYRYQSGPNGGKVLVISPAGLENYFLQVADAFKDGSISWEREQEIARRYGQEFLYRLKHWGQ